jgi:ankyrin repeat protein
VTPLAAAAAQGRALEIYALLLKYGADPSIRGADGKKAIDYAREKKPEAVNLLENISPFLAFVGNKDPNTKYPKEVLVKLRRFLY